VAASKTSGDKPHGGLFDGEGPHGDHRRRRHPRHPYRVSLTAKCSSWDAFHDLFSGNVSQRGLFIPTTTTTEPNEEITVRLLTPDGGELQIGGKVVHVFREPDGTQKGLGIHLAGLEGETLARYTELVAEAARRCQVLPAEEERSDTFELPIDLVSMVEEEAARPPPPPPIPAPPAPGRATPPPIPSPARPRGATPPPIPSGAPHKAAPHKAHRKEPHPPVVGIDFGTTRSSVAVVVNQEVNVLVHEDGGRQIPSVVGFLPDGTVVIGKQAQEMMASDPANAVASPKRLLGRLHGDRELEPYLASMAMPTDRGNYGQVMLHAQGQTYSIPQICAPIIYRLRQLAEEHLGQEVRSAVLTAPVSFDERRMTALREAAGIAGIEALDIIDEPTAAAVAHNFDRDFTGLIAVYDFGGGTFDFSVVDASKSDMEVIATAGDIWLGGDDFDEAIASTVADAFWHDRQIELRNNVVQWQRLLLAAERAKRTLSYKQNAVVELEEAALVQEGQINLRYPLTRIDFARLAEPIIQRSLDTCNEALGLSEIDPRELNAIYMSGGTTYVPAVREAVAAFFGKVGRVAVPPERAVAIGAAMHGARRYVERVTIL
jgi:hypothetical protein